MTRAATSKPVSARARPARRARPAIAAAILCALLSACASDAPKVLTLRIDSDADRVGTLWPMPPETPRYRYAGELVGEHNLRPADGASRSALRDALVWIAGLLDAPARPDVLQRPQTGLVGDTGRILVSDTSRQGIFAFDPTAGTLSVFDRAEGLRTFASPVGVAEAGDGTLLVADADLAIVARLRADGEPGPSFGRGVLRRPTGLAVDRASGRVFVADTHAHDIKVFDRDGALSATWGRRGEAPGEFNFPTHLAWAGGELYVTDTLNSRIQVLDGTTGQVARTIGERGLYVGNLVRPKGVAVDSQRNVYVVESYHDHLLVFDRLGRFLMGFGGVGTGRGRFYLPAGVWVDDRDRVFVADTFNGRVAVFQFLGGGADGEQ